MAFDIIGDIVIIKQPLKMSEEEYVRYIRDKHKYIKTILLQETDVLPPYRVPQYKILWGENKTETVHKEYGLKFKVDVVRSYYSPRLAEERKRIANLVQNGEKVLVMFSGVNPYPIYIAKYSNPEVIYAIELNPFAFKYALENVQLNKVQNKIVTVLGDVRKVSTLISLIQDKDAVISCEKDYLLDILDANIEINNCYIYNYSKDLHEYISKIHAKGKYIVSSKPLEVLGFSGTVILNEKVKIHEKEYDKFGTKFDRIIMPLPKEADTFLDVAIPLVKEGGIIHLYQFFYEEEIPNKAREVLEKYSSLLGFEYEIIDVRKVGNIAPRQYRVCIDFIVTRKLF